MTAPLRYCPLFKPGLAFPPNPSLQPAVQARMSRVSGDESMDELAESMIAQEGFAVAAVLRYVLELCRRENVLDYAVMAGGSKIATVRPLSPAFEFRPGARGRHLSRFAYLRREGARMVLESPRALARLEFEPQTAFSLASVLLCAEPPEGADSPVLQLLADTGFLATPEENSPPAVYWEFHDLLFHRASRLFPGRRTGATWRFQGRIESPPAIKPPMSDCAIPLTRPPAPEAGPGFHEVLESRRSIRDPGVRPITLVQLSEFLFRSVGIRKRIAGGPQEVLLRPYPSGGAIHELEYYIAVHQCDGLEAGFYHYHAGEHALYRLAVAEPDWRSLFATAQASWGGEHPTPNLHFTLAARLPRLAWKYQGLVYRIALINAGAAVQTMYLVATAMGLAPCAVGNGDPARFAAITGLNPMEETSIAEFVLSTMPGT